jgi:hypothetical protein
MPVFNNILAGASGATSEAAAFQIDRSLRFNSDDSAYLNFTPSTSGDKKKWTWSGWVKKCANGGAGALFGAISGGNYMLLRFRSDNDRISIDQYNTGNFYVYTDAVFRDNSAWYHIVCAVDTTQATESNRIKIWANGVQQSLTAGTNWPTQNQDTYVNDTSYGMQIGTISSVKLDGYLAEVNFVDGQALAESDFGEYDDNGVWQPKAYSGTYGTNGFHLDFSDNSSNDALGYDANGTVRYYPDVTGTGISSTVKNLFDGNTGLSVDGTAGTTITFTPSTPIPYSSSVEVYTASGATERTYSLNGGTGVTNVANGWTTLATGSGTITSISNTPNSNYYQSWSAIRVDGVILTDPNDWTVNNIQATAAYGIQNASNIVGVSTKTFYFPITYATTVTYEAFVRVTGDVSYNYLADNGSSNWNIGITTNSVLFGNFSSGYVTFSSTNVHDGNWHFVRLTTTGSSTSLYIDGTLHATEPSGGGVSTGTQVTNNVHSAGSGSMQVAYLRITNGGTPPTTGIPALADMNQPAGTGGTLVFFDKLDDIASSGTKTSDGGNVTITMAGESVPTDQSGVDSFIDSPTNYEADSGNNGGNYATLNPLALGNNITLSNGNLEAGEASTSGHTWAKSTIGVKSGKWYVEIVVDSATGPNAIGLTNYGSKHTGWIGADGSAVNQFNMIYNNGTLRQIFDGNVATTNYISGSQWTTGDVLQIAYDADNDKAWFGINNTWYQADGSSTTLSAVEAGTNATFVNFNYSSEYFFTTDHHDAGFTYNFGQRPFAYTPPTGYKSLCTTNLDDPLIEDPSTAFDIALWSGDGAARNIPTSMSPDLVWIKKRNSATFGNHQLFDAVRQATYALVPNDSQGENEETTQLTAFNSDGFSLGGSTFVNATSNTYVGWAWDAGTSNTDLTAVYNQNQSWSGYMLTPSGGYGNPKEKAFNAQSYNYAETANNGETLDFNSVTGLTASTNVFVLPENTASVSYTVTADIGGTTYTDSSVGQAGVTFSYTGNVTRITVRNNDSNSPTRLTHIKVDSKELIDQNIAVTQPTLDSTYRANTSAGLSIVSYTGNGASSAVIGHGLNAAPKMIMVKNRDVGDHGAVYHVGTDATNPQNYFLKLFAATSDGTASRSDVGAMWNDTAPTSSVFSVGTEDNVNASTENYIAYCWTSVEGYSAFGSYVGNGSADGPFIYTGFKVGWLMVKNSTTSNETWTIHDSTRDVDNPAEHRLLPSSDGGETTGTSPRYKDLLSNGFKIRGTSGEQNTSGNVYVYAAFAENPFKTARAR